MFWCTVQTAAGTFKAGGYEGHECAPTLTPGEEKQAAGLLKRAISTSPDKHQSKPGNHSCLLKDCEMRCLEMQRIRTVVSGGEASSLIQNKVLILSDEERQSLLDKAGISSSIEIGAAEVLAIKAELALPLYKLRFLRWYVTTYSKRTILTHWYFRWLKASGISLAGEERMHHISNQIVGENLKGEMALFSFPLPSGGE